MKYNLHFHGCEIQLKFDIFTAEDYSFFEICIIFNQYVPVFHYFVYNKNAQASLFITGEKFALRLAAISFGVNLVIRVLCVR